MRIAAQLEKTSQVMLAYAMELDAIFINLCIPNHH